MIYLLVEENTLFVNISSWRKGIPSTLFEGFFPTIKGKWYMDFQKREWSNCCFEERSRHGCWITINFVSLVLFLDLSCTYLYCLSAYFVDIVTLSHIHNVRNSCLCHYLKMDNIFEKSLFTPPPPLRLGLPLGIS